ncbi:uncharacterized protein [Dermacentor albipictus]|uniref:uncharacterized protein n=1 Tax=Dermacentor albipictus TaxID=60249 RepID=UPI0038FBFAFB
MSQQDVLDEEFGGFSCTTFKQSFHLGVAAVGKTIHFLRKNNLSLLTADKEGGFVVLPKTMYLEKAKQAIEKNFVPLERTGRKVKAEALKLCEQINLTGLHKSVKAANMPGLNVFFSAKTHKEGIPLRATVSEKEAWQGLVSKYLQKHLSQIDIEDPFRVSNSKDVTEFLGEQDGASQANFAFSVDIEELFYSIPQPELLDAVKERIENWGAVQFQNSSGVSVNDFVALVECYLSSTYICFNDKLFVQKDGICIGSCIAPILSEIFLGQFDKRVAAQFSGSSNDDVPKVSRSLGLPLWLLLRPHLSGGLR